MRLGSKPSWFESVHFLAYFMAYSNSLWNPILYGGFNASFRQGFVRLFLCRRPSFSRGFSRSRDKNGEQTQSTGDDHVTEPDTIEDTV
ncbi:hypothetical protein FJT64_004069 [Amphibalanus amphitrite]|uniref:Uncharacterized protein n=1 Tax=Amphibalanus amphitrite TaxID=1232801 RepID=A0A6A4VWM2_AMPAM|nr:hypothetical protein FJT64_004069 [Amphibalanus amphitrite]